MKKITYENLIKDGYRIENMKITKVDLSMADHGCLTLELWIEGDGIGTCYGGYCLGKGYVGANDDFFSGSDAGMESIIRIMDVVGVDRFNDLKDKYVRIAYKRPCDTVDIIGNIINDKWFNQREFFKERVKDD